jgi:hypothetical protein
MGKGGVHLSGRISLTPYPLAVQRAAAEHIYSYFSDLPSKLSIDDYLIERNRMQDEQFRKVPLMKGALEVVRGLVSLSHSPCTECLIISYHSMMLGCQSPLPLDQVQLG